MSADASMRPLQASDGEACDAIVVSLPYHFGDETGREMCARAVRTSQGWVAERDGRVVAFLTVRAWYGRAVEITWMAVHAHSRRRGIGGDLLEHAAAALPADVRFLVVTTLSESSPEPGVKDSYAGTRAFYRGHRFEPVWEPQGWWNAENQAVLMVRVLNAAPMEHG